MPEKTQDAIVGDHPDINLKSVKRIRKRQQRGHELSGKIILDNPSWNMMHADVFIGIKKRIDHAWLEKDGVIYDPVLDQFF